MRSPTRTLKRIVQALLLCMVTALAVTALRQARADASRPAGAHTISPAELLALAPFSAPDGTLSADPAQRQAHKVDDLLDFYTQWTRIEALLHSEGLPAWAGEYRMESPTYDAQAPYRSLLLSPTRFAEMTYRPEGRVRKREGAAYRRGSLVYLGPCGQAYGCDAVLYIVQRGTCSYLLNGEALDALAARHGQLDEDWDKSYYKRTGNEAGCGHGVLQLPTRDIDAEQMLAPEASCWQQWLLGLVLRPIRMIDDHFLDQLPMPYTLENPAFIVRMRRLSSELRQPGLPDWAGIYIQGGNDRPAGHLLDDYLRSPSFPTDEADGPMPEQSRHMLPGPEFAAMAPRAGALIVRSRTGGGDVVYTESYFAHVHSKGPRLALADPKLVDGGGPLGQPIYKPSNDQYLVLIGARHYLVDEADMTTLVNQINQADTLEAREEVGMGLVRSSDLHASPKGAIVVPEPYGSYVRSSPLAAHVSAITPKVSRTYWGTMVGERIDLHQTMTIDQGSRNQVFVGMTLYVAAHCARPVCPMKRGEVVAVRPESADVDVIVDSENQQLPGLYAINKHEWPGIGAAVTSREVRQP